MKIHLKGFENDFDFLHDNVVVVVVLDVGKSLRQDQEDEVHRFGVEVRADQVVSRRLITGGERKV